MLSCAVLWCAVQVFTAYHSHGAWNNDRLPILVDKAPPTIAKSASLVRYLEGERQMNRSDYRFIIMHQHPCLLKEEYYDRPHHDYSTSAMYLLETVENVPADKRIVVQYHDLISRPDLVAARLVSWLPQLRKLDIFSSGIEYLSKTGRSESLLQYMSQSSCRIKLRRQRVLVHPALVKSQHWNLGLDGCGAAAAVAAAA